MAASQREAVIPEIRARGMGRAMLMPATAGRVAMSMDAVVAEEARRGAKLPVRRMAADRGRTTHSNIPGANR